MGLQFNMLTSGVRAGAVETSTCSYSLYKYW